MPLQSAEDLFETDIDDYVETVMYLAARTARIALRSRSDIADEAPVSARVNRSRLLVSCECANAEMVWISAPVFMCQGCWNQQFDGKWRPVAIPAELGEILALLKCESD